MLSRVLNQLVDAERLDIGVAGEKGLKFLLDHQEIFNGSFSSVKINCGDHPGDSVIRLFKNAFKGYPKVNELYLNSSSRFQIGELVDVRLKIYFKVEILGIYR